MIMNKFKDLVKRVDRYHSTEFTDFVDPDLLGYFFEILKDYRDLQFSILGDKENLEYKVLAVYPDYLPEINRNDFPIKIVKFYGNKELNKLSHRDVLGALMSLGVSRSKFGDILVFDDNIKVFVIEDMARYVSGNLRKIGRYNLENEIEDISEFEEVKIKYDEIMITVKSMRLDAVISSVFNISRGKAVEIINREWVKINYHIEKNQSKSIKSGDIISTRGKGKFLVDCENGFTKKDRVKVKIKKYV